MDAALDKLMPAKKQSSAPSGAEAHLVVFSLGDEHYAVDIGEVWEINTMQPITRIPQVAHYIEGVINLRGEIVPVMDLRKRLGLPAAPHDRNSRIMVVQADQSRLGLVVDGVREVMKIPAVQIEPPRELNLLIEDGYLRGIAKQDGYLVVLLDLQLLLSDHEHSIGEPL